MAHTPMISLVSIAMSLEVASNVRYWLAAVRHAVFHSIEGCSGITQTDQLPWAASSPQD